MLKNTIFIKFAAQYISMKNLFRKIILVLIIIAPISVIAQEQKSEKDKAPASTHAQRKAAKKKWKEQRKIEMEDKKAVKKHHKRIQTKETRKKMREEKHKGDKMRANKKEFFLIRWFKYKRH